MKSLKPSEVILIAVLLIFIFSPMELPNELKGYTSNVFAIMVIILVCMLLFSKANTIVAVIVFIALIKLLYLPDQSVSNPNIHRKRCISPLNKDVFNELAETPFPVTLEEEVIKERVPTHNQSFKDSKANYKPIWKSGLDADKINLQ